MFIKSLFTWCAKRGDLLLVLGLGAVFPGLFSPSLMSAQGLPFDFNPYSFNNVVIGGGGGFIPGIVFSTKEPGLVYARTDIGGAYRFDLHSGHWIPLLDWIGYPDWNLSGVESIASDPVDPQTGISRGRDVYKRVHDRKRRDSPFFRSGSHVPEVQLALQSRQQHAWPWNGREAGHRPKQQ